MYDLSLYWNTSNIIARNYLSKNNDFHLTGQKCPPEYMINESIVPADDVSLAIPAEQVDEYELRMFKFATSFYLTIL